jgi:hypothetical protein
MSARRGGRDVRVVGLLALAFLAWLVLGVITSGVIELVFGRRFPAISSVLALLMVASTWFLRSRRGSK